VKKLRTNAVIQPDSAGHFFLHVGTNLLGKVGNLVYERDLGREKGIRRILDKLGGTSVGKENRRLVQIEWPINLGH
jgi:hypothetical protein